MIRQISPCILHGFKTTYKSKVLQVPLADIGEGIFDVELLTWNVKVGDEVSEFQPLCEVRSDKSTAEISSKYSGKIIKIHTAEGDRVCVGRPLVDVEVWDTQYTGVTDKPKPQKPKNHIDIAEKNSKINLTENKIRAPPRVRALLRNLQIDHEKLGLCPHPVINKSTLKDAVIHLKAFSNEKPKSQQSWSYTQGGTVQKVSSVRRAMAKRMEQCLQVPSFTASEEVKMDKLLCLMKRMAHDHQNLLQEKVAEMLSTLPSTSVSTQHYRFSMLPLIIKVISDAMKQFPLINSRYRCQSEIEMMEEHNIGIAIDTSHGLLVPNIKNVQVKSVSNIYIDAYRLILLAKSKRLNSTDISDGTFTFSNIGSIGSISSQPIVVPPEVCILSMGRLQNLPRFNEDGQVVSSSIARINCSADHRVLDGAYLVRFMNKLKALIEDPHWLGDVI